MRDEKKHPHPHPAEQFSDPEMEQVQRFGEDMGGGPPSDFDEQVENELNARQRAREAGAAKMHAAQTSGSTGLGPTEAEQTLAQQKGALQQQAASAGAQTASQAQAGQSPPSAPAAPSGPQGTTQPYAAQAKGEPG